MTALIAYILGIGSAAVIGYGLHLLRATEREAITAAIITDARRRAYADGYEQAVLDHTRRGLPARVTRQTISA